MPTTPHTMDKAAIKRFAVWARRELIARVSQKALQYGITAEGAEPAEALSIHGKLLSTAEVQQRRALLKQVQSKGYEQVMEEVAYTWFNRFCALRFMEVNAYLPSRVRVFTNEKDEFQPQMLAEALELELEGLDKVQVYAYMEANDKKGLFKYLLITQCNALSPVLPQMFQHIADYTELLFPDNLLREGSVIHEMVTSIPTEDWQDAVQIIGWLYQYYNSEKKDEVFANLKKNVKITKDNIPAATQLFTPDWIVRYMVENSLGRLWVEGHPNEELKQQWRYFLEEAEQEPKVQAQLVDIRKEYAALKPENIKCIDPCCGSGHILAYMFDVLVQIYESCGYTTRDAVRCIVEKNIYGLDIDDRAAQLAYFAVMMKARQYDRRFLTRKDEDNKPDVPQPKVYAICESNSIDEQSMEYFANGDTGMYFSLQTIVRELHDAKEYGSLIKCSPLDYGALYTRAEEIRGGDDMQGVAIVNEIIPLIRVSEALSREFDIVVTNPPYMGNDKMGDKLSSFVKTKYHSGRNDLFSVFITRCVGFTRINALFAMITQHQWMFLSSSSYERNRKLLLTKNNIINMAHLGSRAFDEIGGEVVQTTSFTVRKNANLSRYQSKYIRLTSYSGEEAKRHAFLSCTSPYCVSSNLFSLLPTQQIAYWIGDHMLSLFNNPSLDEAISLREGIHTGDNDRFLRFWTEVVFSDIVYNALNENDVDKSGTWVPYNKGGSYRKWYGNNERVIAYNEENRNAMSRLSGHVRPSQSLYFKEGGTWSALASGKFGIRYYPSGFLFDSKGQVAVGDCALEIIGLLNTKAYQELADILMPTLDYKCGDVKRLPYCHISTPIFLNLVEQNINISKNDWDSFETSWDFKKHPLLRALGSVQSSYEAWERDAFERFYQLKANEEELNRIFIDIYGLQDELTPEVEEKDVTVRKADLGRDIRSLISYAVGCMFGRYSLDVEGLAYAGGDWDASKYSSFPADADNIIPICDDEYFTDDIVGRFVEFIRVAYGADTLEENLRFIADALGGKGSAREVIRKYFRDDFYADHLKIYQKRPIYWQFDSGKKGGFRALVYMHRYKADTLSDLLTRYVHEQQSRYVTMRNDMEQRVQHSTGGEQVKLKKALNKLKEQEDELRKYEEKVRHLSDQRISIDLDDGVKKNYALFSDVLTKIK